MENPPVVEEVKQAERSFTFEFANPDVMYEFMKLHDKAVEASASRAALTLFLSESRNQIRDRYSLMYDPKLDKLEINYDLEEQWCRAIQSDKSGFHEFSMEDDPNASV